ncbi:uncharacterized protein BO95DRAFT_438736, partial [Aspergillus brunneoviolaceus CBS 621.78]
MMTTTTVVVWWWWWWWCCGVVVLWCCGPTESADRGVQLASRLPPWPAKLSHRTDTTV